MSRRIEFHNIQTLQGYLHSPKHRSIYRNDLLEQTNRNDVDLTSLVSSKVLHLVGALYFYSLQVNIKFSVLLLVFSITFPDKTQHEQFILIYRMTTCIRVHVHQCFIHLWNTITETSIQTQCNKKQTFTLHLSFVSFTVFEVFASLIVYSIGLKRHLTVWTQWYSALEVCTCEVRFSNQYCRCLIHVYSLLTMKKVLAKKKSNPEGEWHWQKYPRSGWRLRFHNVHVLSLNYIIQTFENKQILREYVPCLPVFHRFATLSSYMYWAFHKKLVFRAEGKITIPIITYCTVWKEVLGYSFRWSCECRDAYVEVWAQEAHGAACPARLADACMGGSLNHKVW